MPPKEETLRQAQNNMTEALRKIQQSARSYGISVQEAIGALAQLSKTAADIPSPPEDTDGRAKYKTLNYKHEVE